MIIRSLLDPIDRRESNIATALALSCLSFFGLCVVFGWLSQFTAADSWVRPLFLVGSFLISGMAGIAYLLVNEGKGANFYYLMPMVVIGLLTYISGRYIDWSYDGLLYHQRAIASLLDGSNFILNDAPSSSIWVNFYTKATYYYGATLIASLGDVGYGASYNLILAVAAAAYAYRLCFYANIRTDAAIVFSLLILLNPVTTTQWVTFYNDAALGNMAIILFMATLMISWQVHALDRFIFIVSLALILNIKASGVIYVFSALAYLFIKSILIQKDLSGALRKYLLPCLGGLAIGFLVIGYSPYVQNITHGRHIFHPLLGDSKVDIMTTNSPFGFVDHTRLRNLFVSVFSKSVNFPQVFRAEPTLKIPGKVTEDEFLLFAAPDTRLGGFGPLYSAMVLLGVLVSIGFSTHRSLMYPLLFMIGLSVILNPYSWWARYAPLLWILPLLPILCANPRVMRFKSAIFLPLALTVIALINALSIADVAVDYYNRVNNQMRTIAADIGDSHIHVYPLITRYPYNPHIHMHPDPFYPNLVLKTLGIKHYTVISSEIYEMNRDQFHSLGNPPYIGHIPYIQYRVINSKGQ